MNKRMKVCLVDENDEVEISSSGDFDLDVASKMYMRFKTQFLEIGWAEIEQRTEGRLEVKMTLVGTYIVGEGLAPDLTEYKGTIPTSLRKG
jgi:hypothetical protein